MKKHLRKYKLIYFEWADATHPLDSTWYNDDELKEWAKNDDYWVSQCGWVIEENKEYLLVASQIATITSVHVTEAEQMLAQYLKIPKTWIRKLKEIKF
jgi:hypothetical protein